MSCIRGEAKVAMHHNVKWKTILYKRKIIKKDIAAVCNLAVFVILIIGAGVEKMKLCLYFEKCKLAQSLFTNFGNPII